MTKMVATRFLSLSSELHNRMREMRERDKHESSFNQDGSWVSEALFRFLT